MKKYILKTSVLSIAAAIVLATAGCSSGGGGGGGETSAALSGIGIDGILMDAQVCIDADNSGVCEASETTTQTDADGKFTFPAGSPTGPLILSGGIDKSTGESFKGVLKAPAGSEVVTPLTSAIQSMVEGGKSAAEAEATIKTAMGLDDVTVDLTKFDPYNGIDTDPVNAQKILAKQTQLQILVHTAAATIAGADSGTDVADAMSNVFDAIVESMDTGAEVELDADVVAIATRQAAAETYAAKTEAEKNALVVAVGTVAKAEAEDAVSAANGAEAAISGGAAADAIGALDGAINAVNNEDGSATAAAKATQPTDADDLAAIIAAREAEDAAAKATAEAEAAAVAARAAAAQALIDATNQAELEAAERLRAEAAAAEQLAAEKAVAEAAAAEAAAAEEAAIDAAAAAAKIAEAQAAAAAAQAAALQAEIEAEAAAAAAEAIAAADAAADLAALKAAAEAAALAAEQARAAELIGSYKSTANASAATTQSNADLVQIIATAGYSVDVSLTAANDAAVQAGALASSLDAYADSNTTYAELEKNKVIAQAKIAADALSDAQAIKGAADIAASILQGQVDRIAIMAADVNATKIAAQSLYDVNASAVKTEITNYISDISVISSNPLYPDAVAVFNEANASATLATKAYDDTTASLLLIVGADADMVQAKVDVNETAANAAKEVADTEKSKIDGYLSDAYGYADAIEQKLTQAQGIKTAVDNANLAAAIVAAVGAAQDSADDAQDLADDAQDAATAAEAYSSNSNATSFIAAAAQAALDAQGAADDAQGAADDAAVAGIGLSEAQDAATAAENARLAAVGYTATAAEQLLFAQRALVPTDPAAMVDVLKLKADVDSLLNSPKAGADVADAKYMVSQIRETVLTFVNETETGDLNSSTIIGTQADLIETKIQPEIDLIVEDLNVTAEALKASVEAFGDDLNASFSGVIDSIDARFKAIEIATEQYDDNETWGPITVNSDEISHTYSKTGDLVTETFTLNGETITIKWEDTENGDLTHVSTNGAIAISGTDYALDIDTLSFVGTSASFSASGSITGVNGASMELTAFDMSATVDTDAERVTNPSVNFEGIITAGGRSLNGTLAVTSDSATLTGLYTGAQDEPVFNGQIVVNSDFTAFVEDEESGAFEHSYVEAWSALMMATFSDGQTRFVVSREETSSDDTDNGDGSYTEERTNEIVTQDASYSAICTNIQTSNPAGVSNSVTCEDLSGNPVTLEVFHSYEKQVLVTINGEDQLVDGAWLDRNGVENEVRFWIDNLGEAYYDQDGDLAIDGEKITVSAIKYGEVKDPADRDFSFQVDGSITHDSKLLKASVGMSQVANSTYIYAKDIELSDGTNFVKATELSATISKDAFLSLNADGGYYHGDEYSQFENFTIDYNNHDDGDDEEFNPDDITSVKADGLELSITDEDSETLSVKADFSYANNSGAATALFDGNYTYRDTTFIGHIDLSGSFEEITETYTCPSGDCTDTYTEPVGTFNVHGSIEAHGFEPFNVTVSATRTLINDVDQIDIDGLFMRNTYAIGVRISSTEDAAENELFQMNIADTNGVLGQENFEYDAASDTEVVDTPIMITNSVGDSLAEVNDDPGEARWLINYSDSTFETLF